MDKYILGEGYPDGWGGDTGPSTYLAHPLKKIRNEYPWQVLSLVISVQNIFTLFLCWWWGQF